MSALFLSYRRSDSPDTVKLIHERLKKRLPRWEIFYDHESIPLGDQFPERLRTKVTSAAVVLVIIGPKWLEILHERKNDAVDHVREEVRLALQAGKSVVPILVCHAKMPTEADLAEFADLQPLLRRNACPVRPDPDFDGDLEPLVAHIRQFDCEETIGATLADKYTLTAEVGHGGMGVVYRAEQKQPVKRTVAVKLIKPGMDSRDVLARFDAERQALAVMDHPNIAKVHDAGMTAGGRPFFVMEFVKGVPITQYCDDKKLTPEERINLFVPVCNAVQHAHQKGIIHRDLKPSNVLVEVVDGKPVVKVIDFGLAKALGQKLTDQTLYTVVETRIGTLEYSAPEQAAGRSFDVDTRSDIYSLGVMLYELLTGAPPFTHEQLLRIGEKEMCRVISEDEPAKPSKKLSSSGELPAIAANRHLEPHKLTKLVRGDLDWIVMKCLEKEQGRRYETANQLGQELQRYLADEPVQAGPPSVSYRVKKFLRRNRRAVIAAALLFLALIAGVIGTSIGLVQAQQARDAEAKQVQLTTAALVASEENRKLADKGYAAARGSINDFLNDASETHLKNLPGMKAIRKELAVRAVRKLEALSQGRPDDDSLRVEVALAYLRLGVIAGRMDNVQEAEDAFRAAETIQEKLAQKNPDRIECRHALAEIGLERSEMYFWIGKPDKAKEPAEKALAIAREVVAADGDTKRYQMVLARLYHRAGATAGDEPAEKKRQRQGYEQALKIWDNLLEQDPENASVNFHAARTRLNFAYVELDDGNAEQAARAFAAAEKAIKKAVAGDKNNAEYYYILSLVLMGEVNNLAGTHPNVSVAAIRDAGKALEALIGRDATEMKYLSWYATSHEKLGDAYNRWYSAFDAALTHFEAAAKVLHKLAETKGRELPSLLSLIQVYHSAASVEKSRERKDSAASYYQKAIDACEKALRHQPGQQLVCVTEAILYRARAQLYEADDFPAALKDYQAALLVWDRQIVSAPDFAQRDFLLDEYLTLCMDGARMATKANDDSAAGQFFQRAEAALGKGKTRKDQLRRAAVLVRRGDVSLMLKKNAKAAMPLFQQAIDLLKPLAEEAPWHTYLRVTLCEAYAGLAESAAQEKDVEKQVLASRQYLRLVSKLDGKDRQTSLHPNGPPTVAEAKRLSILVGGAKLPGAVLVNCEHQQRVIQRPVYAALSLTGDDPSADQARALREDHKLEVRENARREFRALYKKSREEQVDYQETFRTAFHVSNRRWTRDESMSGEPRVELIAELKDLLTKAEANPADEKNQKTLEEKFAQLYISDRPASLSATMLPLYERWRKVGERAVADAPKQFRARFGIGQALSALARCSAALRKPETRAHFDAAARHLGDMLKGSPSDHEILAALGDVFLERGRWLAADRKTDEALSCFVRAEMFYRAAADLAPDILRYQKLAFRVVDGERFQAVKAADERIAKLSRPSDIPLPANEKSDLDSLKRTISLIFGILANGKPFWAFVAVKSPKYKEFLAAQKAGKMDLTHFDPFGEIVICGEGVEPPDDVIVKVAERYKTDLKKFRANLKEEVERAKKVIQAAEKENEEAKKEPMPKKP